MSMTSTARKLEYALNLRGEHVLLEERRFFSTKYSKIMTSYKIVRCEPGKRRETLLETWKLRDAVLYLAELYLHPPEDGVDNA